MRDYKEIRQRHLKGESMRSIASAMGVSRKTVKKYCEGAAVPWERKTPERKSPILTEKAIEFIRNCFKADEEEGLKKQSHTARVIYNRLVAEMGFTGAESTVRQKVHELRETAPQAFVPLAFSRGEAIQADWGEAHVYINGTRMKVNLFCARLCHSCAPIVFAYYRQNEESFLEAFVRTFDYFDGVPEKAIFDNAKVAVKDGFGAHATKQAGYTALSSHYAFDAVFCNPGEGHEKGLVEGLVGWARRNILVPIPRVQSLSELNRLLMERCREYGEHRIQGRPATVGSMLRDEKTALRPLPKYPFETAKSRNVRVSPTSTVRFNTNDYSVPVEYAGQTVGVKGYSEKVEVYSGGKLIAEHERCFDKHQSIYKIEHYIPLLEQRGRAILNAAPVRQTVPSEIFARLKACSAPREMMAIIKNYCGDNEPEKNVLPLIDDPVTVPLVDLGVYDKLAAREVV